MSTLKKFTEEEMILLRENPNIVSVCPVKLTYSLPFKQWAVEESKKKGMTAVKIFTKAGLTVELLGKSRITAAMKSFKREAASPEGLREPKGKTKEEQMEAFAKAELDKKQTRTAIRELQKQIVHLEQQIEFLKKTNFPLDK